MPVSVGVLEFKGIFRVFSWASVDVVTLVHHVCSVAMINFYFIKAHIYIKNANTRLHYLLGGFSHIVYEPQMSFLETNWDALFRLIKKRF